MVINGSPIEIKPAPESSNIIWQNQFLPKNAKLFRKFVTFSVIALFWLLQIMTIFYFNKKITEYEEEYPQRNCEDVRSNYGEEFDKFAIIQWYDTQIGVETQTNDATQCFCESFYNDYGFTKAYMTKF